MAKFSPDQTAKIYAFPPRGRKAGGFAGNPDTRNLADELAHIPVTVSGGAWYHEEAIDTAQAAPKRGP